MKRPSLFFLSTSPCGMYYKHFTTINEEFRMAVFKLLYFLRNLQMVTLG
jgi:hypothetical protein